MLTNKEQELIVEIRHGNTKAFSEFVDLYKDLVYTISLRLLGNREEAEEVAQDTFIKIFKSLDSFKGDSKVSTWVYRIAYNTCLDRIKRYKKERVFVDVDHVKEIAFSELDDALDKMMKDEKLEMINQCLAKLPPEDTAVLTLFYFEEKNLVEMEKALGLSSNTIKVRLFRARKKLALIMEQSLEREILDNNG